MWSILSTYLFSKPKKKKKSHYLWRGVCLASFQQGDIGHLSIKRRPFFAQQSQQRRKKGKKERNPIQVQIRLLVAIGLLLSQMAALQAIVLILYLMIILQTNKVTAEDEEWKSATATYTKETDGSITIGNVLATSPSVLHVLTFYIYFSC